MSVESDDFGKDIANVLLSPSASADTKKTITKMWQDVASVILDHVRKIKPDFPIGFVITFYDNTNPNDIFEGKWEKVKDRFLLGSGDTYTTNNATGGEATHTLTVDEMPSHRHPVGYRDTAGNYLPLNSTNIASFRRGSEVYSPYINGGITDMAPNGYTGSAIIGSEGGGKSHNNMPPYIVVNHWRRTE